MRTRYKNYSVKPFLKNNKKKFVNGEKKSIFVAPTQKKSLPDHLDNACLLNNSGKKKITILLTEVPQIIHFVIRKVRQINSHIESFLYSVLTENVHRHPGSRYLVAGIHNLHLERFWFVYTMLQKLGM